METCNGTTIAAPAGGRSFSRARKCVAAALLARAGEGGGGASRFTVTDMAAAADTDWKTVRLALQMLQSEGAVRLERHRIFVRQDLLRKAAGSPAPAD